MQYLFCESNYGFEIVFSKLFKSKMTAQSSDKFASLRQNVMGEGQAIATPFGKRRIVYADYIASGRAYGPIEDKIRNFVLPLYANTHTESSATGRQSTAFREEARQIISESLNCSDDDAIIFCGSGCTGAIDKLIRILRLRLPKGVARYGVKTEIDASQRPVVFVGPYEHHSNDVQWRESLAEVITIEETDDGLIDLEDLERQLVRYRDRPLLIGSFSAGSNVTGILSDTHAIARLLNKYGALAAFDYAAAAPYVPIDMNAPDGGHFDAVFISPHKFVGGPGTPGLLVMKKKWASNKTPVIPGGGTVSYVSPCAQSYLDDIEHREEGGTPDIIGSIRAGQVFALQRDFGPQKILETERALADNVIARWSKHPNIQILGSLTAPRLPFFSFLIRHGDKYLHHNFVVALLNDLFGIQSRGGCSCAGPYGHRLLDIDLEMSSEYQSVIDQGVEILKPGWVRLGFNYFFSDTDKDFLLKAVEWVADHGYKMLPHYNFDSSTALWTHKQAKELPLLSLQSPADLPALSAPQDVEDLFRLANAEIAQFEIATDDHECPILNSAPAHLHWFSRQADEQAVVAA